MEEKVNNVENLEDVSPSMDELKVALKNAVNENMALRGALQKTYVEMAYKRLDYLFKVVEADYAFDQDFVLYCAKEIAETIRTDNTESEE